MLIICFATLVVVIISLLVFVGLLCATERHLTALVAGLKASVRESWSLERRQDDALAAAKEEIERLEKRLTLTNKQLVARVLERDEALRRLPGGELVTSKAVVPDEDITRTIPPTTNRALVFGNAIPDDEVTEPSVSVSQGAYSSDDYTAYMGSLQ